MTTFFYGLYPWLFGLLALLILLLIVELGFRWGRRHAQPDRGQTATIQAAILAFLGLLLAFSFSSSQARFDTRRRLAVDEANAIETTYLRAQFLPSPYRERVSALLRDYSVERVPAPNAEAVEKAIQRSEELHRELWSIATQAAQTVAQPAIILLFTESLNEMIDLHTMRVAAYLYRMPAGLLLVLYLAAGLAMGITGYAAGSDKRRNFLVVSGLTILVGIILTIILDLEQPARGIIQIRPTALLQVQESIDSKESQQAP